MKKNILFVCSGNTCRSPMAEAYAKSLGLAAFSRGTWATDGKHMNPHAVAALTEARIGIPHRHRAKLISADDIARAATVLCLDYSHLRDLNDQFPEAKGKIFMLKPDGGEIADPFGSDQKIYDETLQEIRICIDTRLNDLGSPRLISG